MKAVLQRVNNAKVEVNSKIVGEINQGLLVFLGISRDWNQKKFDWLAKKIINIRLWATDTKGAVTHDSRSVPFTEAKPRVKGFDLSVNDIKGSILIVSQFTLFGELKGNKPNFRNALDYEKAKKIYNKFILTLKESGLKIEQGEFGAMMNVSLENDGPVTLILEK